MVFEIYNQTGSTRLGVANGQFADLTPYIKYQGFEGSRNDVDGSNAGRVIDNAEMVRARLATKYKFNITTIPVTNEVATDIEELLMPEFFMVRTDYYTPNSSSVYTCYSNNVTKAYVIHRESGEDYVKLSAPIVQK